MQILAWNQSVVVAVALSIIKHQVVYTFHALPFAVVELTVVILLLLYDGIARHAYSINNRLASRSIVLTVISAAMTGICFEMPTYALIAMLYLAGILLTRLMVKNAFMSGLLTVITNPVILMEASGIGCSSVHLQPELWTLYHLTLLVSYV